jgi:hypothetical protein
MMRRSATPSLLIAFCAIVELSFPMNSIVRWTLEALLAIATLAWFVLAAPKELGDQLVEYLPFLRGVPFGKFARDQGPKNSKVLN